jgi:hypothetical protein
MKKQSGKDEFPGATAFKVWQKGYRGSNLD